MMEAHTAEEASLAEVVSPAAEVDFPVAAEVDFPVAAEEASPAVAVAAAISFKYEFMSVYGTG